MTKGQQAMAVAMICPEPEKGGRGNVSKIETFPETGKVSILETFSFSEEVCLSVRSPCLVSAQIHGERFHFGTVLVLRAASSGVLVRLRSGSANGGRFPGRSSVADSPMHDKLTVNVTLPAVVANGPCDIADFG
jgi:hypothetical protein